LFSSAVFISLIFSASVYPKTTVKASQNLLANPDMSVVKDGVPEDWTMRGQTRTVYDKESGITTVYTELTHDFILQNVSLEPGHYLLRALAKTNTYAVALKAIGLMPLGASDEYRWAELPFYIDGAGAGNLSAMVGIYVPSTGGGRQGDIFAKTQIKKMELIRLGDTALPRHWGKTVPVHPLHELETINETPSWNRPGKVIFHDTFLGTELWLMTQDGNINLSYCGFPDFSNEGKYVQVNWRRDGEIMRTDGSFRHNPPAPGLWRSNLWLFPWERKRLPESTDPADWIIGSPSDSLRDARRSTSKIPLLNLSTGQVHTIELPRREGWQIISVPSKHASGRGPNISAIDHEILVWYSEDKKHLAISNTEGESFRTFKIKSISRKPEEDAELPVNHNIFGGTVRLYDSWYNPVDENGTRYFIFDINRGKSISDPHNPYQLWALPLDEKDERGLLRVLPNPEKNIPEDSRGGWGQFTLNYREEGCLLLEDGTFVYGSALGLHSGFQGTIRASSGYNTPVRFIGSYPRMDHVSWPSEVHLDRDFATVWASGFPGLTVAMIDLEHDAPWTLVTKNYYDYYDRGKKEYEIERKKGLGRGAGRAYASLITPAPTPSPDFTKVLYSSSMLSIDNAEGTYGDAYIAVAHYPQPPVNVRLEGSSLVWEKPCYSAEIMGFNVYYSKESGKGSWVRQNSRPVKETNYSLSEEKDGFYAVTSVEHSGLESRNFSNEASTDSNRVFRHFYQPAEGKMTKPMVPFFEPKGASNLYAVAVTDPELIYKQLLEEGLEGSVKIEAEIPLRGRWRILARVRGMSGIERSSYTTGWEPQGEPGKGVFTVKVGNKVAGRVPVEGFEWKWVEMESTALNLPAGKAEIVFSTSDAGIALDNVLVTNDPAFIPFNSDNTPTAKPSVPSGLRIEEMKSEGEPLEWRGYTVKPPYVKLLWEPAAAPQGIRYYNIYRGREKDFNASQKTLIGSNSETFFIDLELARNTPYYYRIVAVDNWDNRSEPSDEITVKVE